MEVSRHLLQHRRLLLRELPEDRNTEQEEGIHREPCTDCNGRDHVLQVMYELVRMLGGLSMACGSETKLERLKQNPPSPKDHA